MRMPDARRAESIDRARPFAQALLQMPLSQLQTDEPFAGASFRFRDAPCDGIPGCRARPVTNGPGRCRKNTSRRFYTQRSNGARDLLYVLRVRIAPEGNSRLVQYRHTVVRT